jgi:hypothetical protein
MLVVSDNQNYQNGAVSNQLTGVGRGGSVLVPGGESEYSMLMCDRGG